MVDADGASAPATAWHAMLKERDAAVHRDVAERSVADAVLMLEQRLVQATAVSHALREGIVLRDRLLREQSLAIDEAGRANQALGQTLAQARTTRGLLVQLVRSARARARRLLRRSA